MTLATRCSACGTSFRVVQDQLKVSGGWVRCGRCNEIFNALDGLYEIYTQPGELQVPAPRPDTVAAALDMPPPAATRPVPAPARPPAASPLAHTPPAPTRAADERIESPQRPAPDVLRHAAAPVSGSPSRPFERDVPAAHGHSTLPATVPSAAASVSLNDSDDAGASGFPLSVHVHDDEETRLEPRMSGTGDGAASPSFMESARARASRPAARGPWLPWAVLALVLVVLALAQLAMAYRHPLAAQVPAVAPALRAACALLGCTVEAPRNIAALTLEGSNLRQRTTEGRYDLVVNLRNRSDLTLRLPAFELTLTDTQGQPIVRRVLRAAELGAGAENIAAGADLSLQSVLDISDRRVAGYTIEIFYP